MALHISSVMGVAICGSSGGGVALLTGRLLIIKGTMCSDSLGSVSRNILILSARTDISQLLFYRGRETHTHTQGEGREGEGERGRERRQRGDGEKGE